MKKSKFTIIGILITTIILAVVAVFTAIRLYQTRQTAVAPNVPSSQPKAAGRCELSFSFNLTTATPTSTATATATATATSTAVPKCNSVCNVDDDCPGTLSCYKETTDSTGYCRNTSTVACSLSTTCVCQTATPTATATATSNPQCNSNCSENTDCPNGLMCYKPNGATTGSCRNTSCLSENNCLCPQPTATATTQPELPSVGTTWPTVVGTGFGILVILGSLLLAF